QANSDVLGSFGFRGAVLDPLAGMSDHGLTGSHFQHAASMADPQRAVEHQGNLLKLGSLAGLDPARRTVQKSETNVGMTGVHPPYILVDDNWLVARCCDAARGENQGRHSAPSFATACHWHRMHGASASE